MLFTSQFIFMVTVTSYALSADPEVNIINDKSGCYSSHKYFILNKRTYHMDHSISSIYCNSMCYFNLNSASAEWHIHCQQKVFGHLLQWELHSKHHIGNAISRQPNAVGWRSFAILCSKSFYKRKHFVEEMINEIYIYIHCITRLGHFVHVSIEMTWTIVCYGESDVIYF